MKRKSITNLNESISKSRNKKYESINLPVEIIIFIIIISNLSKSVDIFALSQTCKRMRDICNSNIIWNTKYCNKFPNRGIPPIDVYIKMYYYDTIYLEKIIRYGFINRTQSDIITKRNIYWDDFPEQLDCQRYWDWNPEEDSETEWIEE